MVSDELNLIGAVIKIWSSHSDLYDGTKCMHVWMHYCKSV